MKTLIILFLSLVSSVFAQTCFLSGQRAEWGWSGKAKGNYSKEAVIAVLEQNWGKTSHFNLQGMVDQTTAAEFLWNVTADQVNDANSTASSFIVAGADVTNLVISLDASGKGEIHLYSQGSLVGRVRCQSAAKREGKNSQLGEGRYKVSSKEEVHISKEFKGARMPKALCVNASRGIYVHCGDLTSESGGCIRVSAPVGRELFRLVDQGTSVEMVWK